MGFYSFIADRLKPDPAAEEGEPALCAACPLTGLAPGQTVCLDCIHAGKRLRRRLAELGLTPGVEMVVLQNNGGPLLLSVRDSRLALGRGMAAKVEVTPISGAKRG